MSALVEKVLAELARYEHPLFHFHAVPADGGVELRILHASLPSRAFRNEFDRHRRLVRGGLALRSCARVHLKTVIVDAELLYLGSANWTGAGLGAKGSGRRNFELGITTSDERVIDEVQALYDQIWRGAECAGCRLRDEECEAPLCDAEPLTRGARPSVGLGALRRVESLDASDASAPEEFAPLRRSAPGSLRSRVP